MSKAKITVDVEEQQFALLLATGYNQTDAYKEVFPRSKRWKADSVTNKASEFARRASVQARVRELLRASRLSDLTSIGEWYQQLMDAIERAKDDGAHSAEMTGIRQAGQAIGALQNTVVLDASSLVSDDALIARLAGDDPRKAAMLRAIIGAEDFEQETPKH